MTPREAPRRRQVVFVGQKIRQLRKERGLTQAELAKRIGVQQSDLCRMEIGEYRVSLDTMFRILGVFRIDVAEFFQNRIERKDATRETQEILRLLEGMDDSSRGEVLEFARFKAVPRNGTERS